MRIAPNVEVIRKGKRIFVKWGEHLIEITTPKFGGEMGEEELANFIKLLAELFSSSTSSAG